MNREIRVMIADDHPIFRKGLRTVLEADPQLDVVAESGDGSSALIAIRELRPHVAVLDIDMPAPDGLAIARIIQSEHLPVQVVFLTMHNDRQMFTAALDAGVNGFVIKDGAASEIVGCIKSVADGQPYFSPALSRFLLARRESAEQLDRELPAVRLLTPSERRVLRLLGESKTSKEIADALFISVRTVHHHRENIAGKLGLEGRNALITFAIKHREELQA